MKVNILFIFFLVVFPVFSQTQIPSVILKVEGGLVEGTTEDGVISYKGIPFAAPPTGDLRWRPPQPVKRWEGILKAYKFAPVCPQPTMPMLISLGSSMSEDCLYLNIWKPVESSGKNLPVLVWIHGGAFSMGGTSQSLYSGEKLAKKGVIVVSIAYRLGALGFLALTELNAESKMQVSGNYGLLDQIAALKWIQRNIRIFGGDAGKVTIFGESAGGQSVNCLAASPLTKGLFQRGICMSGGMFGPATLKKETDGMQLLKGAVSDGLEFQKRMGANSLNDLRKMDAQKIIEKQGRGIQNGFAPVIDGYIIPDDLPTLYETGKYHDIPILLGTTSNEGSMFTMRTQTSEYEEYTRRRFGPFANKILELYPQGTDSITRISIVDLVTDSYLGWYTFSWASLQSKTGKSPVFLYYFDQPQPLSPATFLFKSNKPYHGSDLPYVFDHLDQDPKVKYTDEDKQLSDLMVNYWINFAKSGNPNGKDLPEWPVYNQENAQGMYLKGKPYVATLPNRDKLKVIDEYYQWKRAKAKEFN